MMEMIRRYLISLKSPNPGLFWHLVDVEERYRDKNRIYEENF